MRRSLTLLAGLLAAQSLWAASGMDYVPGRLSVRFLQQPSIDRSGASLQLGADFAPLLKDFPLEAVRPLIRRMRVATTPDLSLNYVLSFDPSLDMEVLAAMFEATGKVEYAEPDYLLPVRRTPNDPSFNQQSSYLNRVQAPQAWDLIPQTPSNPDMIIAVIDSGVDWNHPDLVNRVWVNPDEDLDNDQAPPSGTVPGEAAERNNQDDGGNGFADDFYGWDFVDGVTGCAPGEDCTTPDNNPMDYNGHGTHCAGISAAQTNNSVGVASISWDARIMCLRAGYSAADGNGFVQQTAASEALYYAIDNGAKIVTMSFGGSGTIRTAATAAYNNGLLCFHAAGNENVSEQDALDRSTGMVSVAATNSSDYKADFSNYGDWVDVSAPGVSIYNTFFDNTYAYLDGTSMACPNAASCAALIWWMNPELTNAQLRERLLATTDDIYDTNPSYEGLLGTGRINAYKGLMDIRETSISVGGISVRDEDGDGRFLQGDILDVVYTLNNTGRNTTQQLRATLSCTSPAIEVLTDTLFVTDLESGESLDGSTQPLRVRVLDDSPNWVDFSLGFGCDNATAVAGEASAMLGRPNILLYDDSAAETDLPVYYKAAFRQLGWILDWYQASSGSFPNLPGETLDMGRYTWAIYASGRNTSTFSAAEQTLFTDFVNSGHDLIVSSTYADEEIAGTPFFSQILEAADGGATSTTRGAKGVAGTFTEGISMILQGAGGANNQDASISEVTVAGDGQAIFNDNANVFPIGVNNGYGPNRVAYLAFSLEAAGGAGSSLNTGEVLQQLVDEYLLSTDVDAPTTRPRSARLQEAVPNPFNPVTRISFELPQAARVRLVASNVLGQDVATLLDGRLSAGSHSQAFHAGSLPSGLYLVRLELDGRLADQQKVLLVK